ncbi:ABC transporter ATP-binding protein [Conexibacter sp. JD483]|uniref:dipeptide ABC transporter ATP-binding protein n=1 Tax=unclassified Conexibacter TaxID=2627773 RepID=UPI00271CF09A|nr:MULTISPECIES: ABC transporter ATP-binding protein [unclassified Conexibacter]MDO8188504.1 ABC transporter ATP-binding protein [Conexibacter sp. CPCC 205706]MDO8200152.1 ABC transporter ATP-binding protein [Conexibacter sp. CPCC 205762]MDR9371191.1 ABC transporter ATP-binding protein [Conexibacter sp. JD483]
MSADAAALEIAGLVVRAPGGAAIVEQVELTVRGAEIVALVGESGSGKTTCGLAALGFARDGARIDGGSVRVAGRELLGLGERELRGVRGRHVSYVPQNPGSALNPAMRVGDHLRELLRAHGRAGDDAVVQAALERVHLPGERAFRRRWPHQLSGGQQQRLAIALALACEPAVAVMDEPTTGLDVVTQARILDEVRRLRDASGLGVLYISHDLAAVASIADRIAVMYAGRVVEQGPAAELLARPCHPYTRGLLASLPDHREPRRLRGIGGAVAALDARPAGCAFAPRCPLASDACRAQAPPLTSPAADRAVRCFHAAQTPPPAFEPLPQRAAADGAALLAVRDLRVSFGGGDVVAADDVGFALARGECLALVGESGSGKTTIARCVAGLQRPDGGEIALAGEPLAGFARGRTREQRRRLQIVFQNPYQSLNPRETAIEAVARPLRELGRDHAAGGRAASLRAAEQMLERVQLPRRLAHSRPAALSGGELQRVAIARALVVEPELLLCDEITSALDVSVQAAVLELLGGLRDELGLTLLFITHDLGVVAAIADRVLVLQRGSVVETGPVGQVVRAPAQPYTQELVAAAPSLSR